MARAKHAFWVLLLLAACSGSPFVEDGGSDGGDGGGIVDGGDGDGIDGDTVYPPGTSSPSRSSTIIRYEPEGDGAEGNTGDGRVSSVSYDRDTDTFAVDGLAFDGDRPYRRGRAVDSIGPYAVYEARLRATDPQTGASVPQFQHRAIYGVSRSGRTKFAIVRTGGYLDYGFGGFIYQRKGGVTLPRSGQATYRGDYAALRDFSGAGGVGFTRGRALVNIDFDDFNDGAGVDGRIGSRRYFDVNGNDITDAYLDRLAEDTGVSQTRLPVLRFKVGPGVMDANGEILGEISSGVNSEDGFRAHEDGRYYAMVSGRDADEIVGIVVVESDYPGSEGVKMRETGGFIVYRDEE